MSDEDVERRKRLKALRERAEKSKGQTKEISSTPTLKFRNYRPQDETIKGRNPGSSTTKPKAQSDEKDRGDRRRLAATLHKVGTSNIDHCRHEDSP